MSYQYSSAKRKLRGKNKNPPPFPSSTPVLMHAPLTHKYWCSCKTQAHKRQWAGITEYCSGETLASSMLTLDETET